MSTANGRMLVAGGGGFLGRSIGCAAHRAGFDVHVTWRTTQVCGDLPAHRCDLDDADQVGPLVRRLRPDIVVMALGGPHRPATEAERFAVWRDGPIATAAVLEACRALAPHVVFLASSHEFAPSSEPHTEDAAVGPVSLRGIAARASVHTVRWWSAATGATTTVLRPFSVYGPGEPGDRIVPTVLRAALTGAPFHTAAGHTGRDYVYVDDVSEAVVIAGSHRVGGEFNLGTGVNTTAEQLAKAAEVATGRPVDVRPATFESRPWDRERWVADPSRAAADLGWRATTSLVDGLRRSIP